jgi:transposase-like protein
MMRSRKRRQWHLNEVFVKINGVTHHMWRLNRAAALVEWRGLLAA